MSVNYNGKSTWPFEEGITFLSRPFASFFPQLPMVIYVKTQNTRSKSLEPSIEKGRNMECLDEFAAQTTTKVRVGNHCGRPIREEPPNRS